MQLIDYFISLQHKLNSKKKMTDKLLKQVEELKSLVSKVDKDANSFVSNKNKAASTRVRTTSSAIAKLVKEIRATVIEVREEFDK